MASTKQWLGEIQGDQETVAVRNGGYRREREGQDLKGTVCYC